MSVCECDTCQTEPGQLNQSDEYPFIWFHTECERAFVCDRCQIIHYNQDHDSLCVCDYCHKGQYCSDCIRFLDYICSNCSDIKHQMNDMPLPDAIVSLISEYALGKKMK